MSSYATPHVPQAQHALIELAWHAKRQRSCFLGFDPDWRLDARQALEGDGFLEGFESFGAEPNIPLEALVMLEVLANKWTKKSMFVGHRLMDL